MHQLEEARLSNKGPCFEESAQRNLVLVPLAVLHRNSCFRNPNLSIGKLTPTSPISNVMLNIVLKAENYSESLHGTWDCTSLTRSIQYQWLWSEDNSLSDQLAKRVLSGTEDSKKRTHLLLFEAQPCDTGISFYLRSAHLHGFLNKRKIAEWFYYRKNQLGYTVKVFTIYTPNSADTRHSRGSWYQNHQLSSTNTKTQTCFGP